MHLVSVIDERLRERFFPDARQSYALNYAVVRADKVVLRRTCRLSLAAAFRRVAPVEFSRAFQRPELGSGSAA